MSLSRKLAAGCVAFALTAPAFAATTPISTVAQLNTVFAKTAQSGDVLSLACGTYAMPNLQSRKFSPPLVITSADPTCKAVIQGMKLANVSGVTFTGLELETYTETGPVDPYYAFRLGGCAQITFDHDYIHGDPALAPVAQINAFYPSGCQGVAFNDDAFVNLNAGLNVQKSTGLHVERSYFGRMAKGAMEIGGTSYVDIGDNWITDFETGSGTHGDGIQIFTFGETAPAHDINIHGNLITRGAGVPAQGIFVQDETKTLPFYNVNISDNAVIGEQWNSIMLNGATGSVQMTGNLVATWPGPDPVASPNVAAPFGYGTTNFNGYLRFDNGGTATANITGNQFQQFILNGKNAATPAANTQLGPVTDGGAAFEAAWRASHPAYPAAPAQ
jgi:hypothetical protein